MFKQWLKQAFSPWGKTVVASFLAATSLFMLLPVGTGANTIPVQLNISGFGSTSWSIPNMKPGDTGFEPVTIQNVGNNPGKVTIWISNISTSKSASVDPKFQGPPMIDQRLTLQATGTDLNSNFTMPATFNVFPTSATSTQKLTIDSLAAGASTDITWTWALPYATGNEVQGDTLNFDVNYMIEDLGSATPVTPVSPVQPIQPAPVPQQPGPAPTTGSIQLVVPGAEATSGLTDSTTGSDAVTTDPLTATSPRNSAGQITEISISIPPMAVVLNQNIDQIKAQTGVTIGRTPQQIKAAVYAEKPLTMPEGWKLVSNIYQVLAYTDGIPDHVTVDPPADIVLGYNQALLPAQVNDIALFYYNEDTGVWIQLQAPAGYVASAGQAAAEVGHFSVFAVLAKGTDEEVAPGAPTTPGTEPGTEPGLPTTPGTEPGTQPGIPSTPGTEPVTPGTGTEPVVTPPPTAKFEIKNLIVNPPEIQVGGKSDVTAIVTNVGGVAGEYTATLTLDGNPIAQQTVTLQPGESQTVTYTVNPDLPGVYGVVVNGLDGQLNVIKMPSTLNPRSPNYWWLILLGLAFLLIMTVLFRPGGVLVTVPTGEKKRLIPLFVPVDALKEIIILPVNPSINTGKLIKFKAMAKYYDNTQENVTLKVTWTSQHDEIASVDKKGLAQGLKPGVTAIFATWHDKTGRTLLGVNCTVIDPEQLLTVPAGFKEVKAITVIPTSPTIANGNAQHFKATVTYMDGTEEDITERAIWTSTNDFVADIDRSGRAIAYADGVTEIVATFRGHRGTTNLTVTRRFRG